MHVHKPITDLKFNVAQLLREETGSKRNYDFAENALELDETTMLRQLVGKVRFTRTASGVLADVNARGVINTECTRCLNAAQQQIEIHFQDEFHSRIDVNTGFPLPTPEEEDPFFIDEAHMVDLGEAIREYGLIALPMQALCKPDCKGLCPECGADLNVEPGHTHESEGDERFSVLRNLLNE